MRQIRCTRQDFSRQFLTQNQTPFKNADFFFLRTTFPPKDLVLFWHFFRSLLKAQTFSPSQDFQKFLDRNLKMAMNMSTLLSKSASLLRLRVVDEKNTVSGILCSIHLYPSKLIPSNILLQFISLVNSQLCNLLLLSLNLKRRVNGTKFQCKYHNW